MIGRKLLVRFGDDGGEKQTSTGRCGGSVL